MTNNISTIITYDFFYTNDGNPWFCSYSVTVLDGAKLVHSELIQLDALEDFERLLKNAQEQKFTKEYEHTNPNTGAYGDTYRKFFLAE